MSEVGVYNYQKTVSSRANPVMKGGENEAYNLEAHTSTNMKVKRPKITPNDLTMVLPQRKPFSDEEATKKIRAINTDIYEGAVKEKEKHEFNLKRYFTIFGIIALLTAALGYSRKGGRK